MTSLRPTRRLGDATPGPRCLRRIRSAKARPLRTWLAVALLTESRPAARRPRPRAGQVFLPEENDLGAWRRLIGRSVRLDFDLAGSISGDAVPLAGVVRRFRIEDGTPLMAIEGPAGCILIDPRWWLITVRRCGKEAGTRCQLPYRTPGSGRAFPVAGPRTARRRAL